jgi:hypothetical protein
MTSICEVANSNLGTPTIVTDIFRHFTQLLQENVGIVPKIMPRLVSSTSFPVHYSRSFSEAYETLCTYAVQVTESVVT